MPSTSGPAAASGIPPPRAAEGPAAPQPLQPRAGGSDAAAAMAPRQSLQVLRQGQQAVAGLAAGASPPGQHVIGIPLPDYLPAGPEGPVGQRDNSHWLCLGGTLAAVATVGSIVGSATARHETGRLTGGLLAGLFGSASVASFWRMVATLRGDRHPAAMRGDGR